MTEKVLIPELRFPDFEGEWEEKRIEDFYFLISGQHLKPDEYSSNNIETNIPYFTGPSDFTNDLEEVSKWMINSGKEASRGNILFTVKGSGVGTAMILKLEKVGMGRQLMAIGSGRASTYFLYLKLETLKNYFIAIASGNMIPGLSRDDILKTKLFFPSISEQQKIASFLTAVDQRIQLLQEKKAQLERYKKGVMQKLFSQEIRFKYEDGNDFPEWEYRMLKDVFDEVTDKVGNRQLETYSITAGYGFVSQKSKFGRDISGFQNEKYTVLQEGQFSYNKGNSKSYAYGCIYVNRIGKDIAVPNVFISFSLKDINMSSYFFEKLFESHFLDPQLRRIISSSARMDGLLNVGKKYFFELKIPVPKVEEQHKISSLLEALDHSISYATDQVEKSVLFKKALLQKMFV